MKSRRLQVFIWASLVAAWAVHLPVRAEEDKPAGNVERPQVIVEAAVLEWQVTDDFDFNYALRYIGSPDRNLDQIDLTLPADPSLASAARIFFEETDIRDGTLDGYIEALDRYGTVHIHAQSKIPLVVSELSSQINDPGVDFSARNHYRGKVSNETKIPYETAETAGLRLISVTQYLDTGIVLEVGVPAVVGDLVVLDVRASMNDLSGFINVGLNNENRAMRVPLAEGRTIQNRLIVPDRRNYLAGMMKVTRKSHQRRGIPWISELPILNIVLSSHKVRYHDSELLFLVRPEVLTPYRLVDPEVVAAGGNQR